MTETNQPKLDSTRVQYLEERVEEMEFLQRLDRELTWVLDPEHVLNITMDWALRRTASPAGLIARLNENHLQVVRLMGAPPLVVERLTKEVWPIGSGIISEAIQQKKVINVSNVKDQSNYETVILENALSVLTFPLIYKGNVIAVLHLESDKPNYFAPDMASFVDQVSQRAGTALHNAETYSNTHNAEQLKSDMIRMAAHDLRTPMTTITTGLHILKSQAESLPNASRQSLQAIDRSVKHMRLLIEELLTLEKLEAEVVTEAEPVNLKTALHDALERVQSMAESKSHQLKINSPSFPVFAMGEPAFFRQAMINLISNAIKYTPPSGNILIRLEQHGSRIFFDVADNGYGISKERQAKLFQRFYRANEPSTSHVQGTGLGLSLVRSIVERAEGQVWFESEVDKGSTFGFWLPATEKQEEKRPMTEAEQTQPTKPFDLSLAMQRRRARQMGQSFQ